MTHLLKPTDNGLASLDEVRAWMEAHKDIPKTPRTTSGTETECNGKFIDYKNSAFTLYNVKVYDDYYDVYWTAKMLGGSNREHTLTKWIQTPGYRTLNNTVYTIPSLPETIAVIQALHDNASIDDIDQRSWIESLKGQFTKDITEGGIMLNTFIEYDLGPPFAPDMITHGAHTAREKKAYCQLQRGTGYVRTYHDCAATLYGSQDTVAIEAAFWWLFGSPFLWSDPILDVSTERNVQ